MMRTRKATVVALLMATVAVFTGAASCDKATEPFKDAPRSGANTDPAETGTMPDGFNNWSAKCDGPNMVYTLYHGNSSYGSISVAPNDPRCPGYVKPYTGPSPTVP